MRPKINKEIKHWISVITLGIVLGFGIQFVKAWTEPTLPPPGGNLGAPINTSNIGQIKNGNLVLNSLGNWANGLLIPYGKVGIGIANPQYKLDLGTHISSIVRTHELYAERSDGKRIVITPEFMSFSNDLTIWNNMIHRNVGDLEIGAGDRIRLMGKAIDVNNNRVQNVATPIAGTDAVNKDYVDAQVGGGGGITGGCTSTVGESKTNFRWGKGCKASFGGAAACSDVEDDGYDCGVASFEGATSACVCVKK